MRSDFRDIRFTQQGGTNCPYWIETYTARTSATVWIKVPSASQTILFMYYGNGGVASASSGTNTFDLFDDFLGTTLDTDKWTSEALAGGTGSISVSGGICTITRAGGNGWTLKSNTTFGTGYAFRSKFNIPDATKYGFGGFETVTNYSTLVYTDTPGANHFNIINRNPAGTNTSADVGAGYTGYHVFDVCRNASTSVIYAADDSTLGTLSTNVPTGSLNVRFGAQEQTIYVDWVVVRKYVATEPTLAVYSCGINPEMSRSAKRLCGITLTVGTEYVFDPVNVDHGMTAAAGAQEVTEATANVSHGMTAAAGAQDVECGAINIYHAMYPTAAWAQIIDPVVDSGYLISVTVSQSMDDAMAEAVFEYDGNEIGNYFSGDYMTKIHVNIPDYLGVSNCVFVGIIPSSKAVYDVAKDKMTMRAVDYGLFLSKQTMEIKDLSLLPPDDQTAEGSNVAKTLSCDTVSKAFQIGMNITGIASLATGTILYITQSTNGYILTLYPATGKFVDDEELSVGGVTYAYADGRSVDIPYTPYYATISPEDWVRAILGGDNWMRTTGIEPTVLESSSEYWATDACPAIPFMFGSLEKKRDALKRVAAYMDYMWHVKPRSIGTGSYNQAGYFIKKTSIDTLLGLPAAATITGPDAFAGPITLDQDGELQVDVVKVRCQDLFGNWMEEIRSNSYYDAGEGPYREFPDEPKDIATRADLAAYATDMYNLYSARTCSWSAMLLERSDLQLYQLLTISGMGTEVPAGTYRIIKIAHEYGCAKNLTHITFMLSSAFSILRKYGMTYKDSISKAQQIIEGLENRKPQTELATVTANDGWTITYETEAGNKGMGRDSTSTPTTAGGIPVGAKVSVQTIRGGVVCIPILGADAYSTSLLTVDVPTIISATIDPADHNYWELIWTPGANNTNVSVNVQTTGYPSAHGVVLPYGNDASCFTRLVRKSCTALRARFSGPSTTYYIKLWGEKNGVYSATGAQATITSGADVAVPDTSEEPEEIGVIDQSLASGFISDDEPSGSSVEIFNGSLPFVYNGVDNIYIGGPVSDASIATAGIRGWTAQPVPRYAFRDNYITITANGQTITVGSGATIGWFAPVLISGILNVGANTVVITLHNQTTYVEPNPMGITDLWVRSYYL